MEEVKDFFFFGIKNKSLVLFIIKNQYFIDGFFLNLQFFLVN